MSLCPGPGTTPGVGGWTEGETDRQAGMWKDRQVGGGVGRWTNTWVGAQVEGQMGDGVKCPPCLVPPNPAGRAGADPMGMGQH